MHYRVSQCHFAAIKLQKQDKAGLCSHDLSFSLNKVCHTHIVNKVFVLNERVCADLPNSHRLVGALCVVGDVQLCSCNH